MINLKKRSERVRPAIFVLYTALLTVGMLLPSNRIPDALARASDKVLHFFLFSLLVLFGYRAFCSSKKSVFSSQAAPIASFFSLFYGALLEWLQTYVPGRSSSLSDWIANALGVGVAFVAVKVAQKNSNHS